MKMAMYFKNWNIEEMTGYKPITTFYMDFSIADNFGIDAIKDTYKRALINAKTCGYKYLTELCMVFNWKIWEHYGSNDEYAKLYNSYWEKLDNELYNTLKGEELSYYLNTTD